MASALAIYLQNHEAAARAGRDLARRAATNQQSRPYGDELAGLAAEIYEDLETLRGLLRSVGCRPNLLLGAALQAGERIGRIKPNGRVLRRSPLSDLVEIEALLIAVQAKRAGWVALAAAEPLDRVDRGIIDELQLRAEDQTARLQAIHRSVATRVLPLPT